LFEIRQRPIFAFHLIPTLYPDYPFAGPIKQPNVRRRWVTEPTTARFELGDFVSIKRPPNYNYRDQQDHKWELHNSLDSEQLWSTYCRCNSFSTALANALTSIRVGRL
jgi:hypothetical protein